MRYKPIATLFLSTLLAGWGGLPANSVDTDNLQAKLDTAMGEYRIHLFEQIYYKSLETDDLDYQYRCVNDLIAETRRQKYDKAEADALAERTLLFYNNAMDDSVLTVSRQDMQRLKELNCWDLYYEVWWYVANTYVYMGQNNIAIRETQAMFDDAKKRNNPLGMGQANCIMGQAYSNMRNFEKSIEVFDKSLDYLSSITSTPSVLAEVYVFYGEALNNKKDYVRLEQLTHRWHAFLQKAMKERKLEGTPAGDIYWSYYYLACVQADLGLGKAEEAAQHLKEARRYIKNNIDNQLGGKWYYCSAQLAMLQGRYEEALNLNTVGAEKLLAGNDSSVQVAVGMQRAEILEKLGRYADAAHLYKDTYVLNDSLNAQETRRQLVEMNSIFQVGEKELENERLQRENERATFRFVIIVISVIVVSLIFFLYYRIKDVRQLKEAKERIEELSKLKSLFIQNSMKNNNQEMHDIFISYSRSNIETVKIVKDTICKFTNAKCWLDLERIESGTSYFPKTIIEGIEQCEIFLFMLSEQSQVSKYALNELNYAIEDSRRHVVLINIDSSKLTKEFRFLYGLSDMIDWNDQFQQDKLIRDIKRWITYRS